MAESSIQITQGSGTNIDVVGPGGGSTYRQLVAIGDPASTLAAAIANVSNGALSVGATLYGTPNVALAANTSITAFQGGSPWTANASIVGIPAVSQSGAWNVTASLANNATVTAFQGGAPWTANVSVQGTVPVSGFPTSVNVSLLAPATVTLSGSIGANVSLQGNPAIAQSGTWNVVASLAGSATLTAFQGAAPWTANVSVQGTVPVSGFPTAVNVSLLAPATVTLAGAVTLGGVNLNPANYGGWSSFQTSAMASTVTISAAAGKFGGYMVMNLNSTPAYLQVFDLTSNVTLGLTTPNMILPLPANSTAANGLAANLELTNGAALANGLKIGATQGATNASVVATGIVGTFWYK